MAVVAMNAVSHNRTVDNAALTQMFKTTLEAQHKSMLISQEMSIRSSEAIL